MDTQLSSTLSTIPPKKLELEKKITLESCEKCKNLELDKACVRCNTINTALERYAKANIPVKYWRIKMDDSFLGEEILKNKYLEVVGEHNCNLANSYRSGLSLCFLGPHGIGKTTVMSNILKRALEQGYTAQYMSLNHLINSLIYDNENKNLIRSELMRVDFLAIDELDPRHIGSDNAADLFGRVLEDIFRTRTQNNMPTFLSTNATKIEDTFQGAIKNSIISLMNYVKKVPVIGKDLRTQGV